MSRRRTGHAVEGDVLGLLRGSELASLVGGGVYRFGMRPPNSRAEDIVVRFVAGQEGDVQTGVVAVLIYVPDVSPWPEGVMVRDAGRCGELEGAALRWVDSLTASRGGYRFELAQTVCTVADPDIGQHFVSVRLRYSYF